MTLAGHPAGVLATPVLATVVDLAAERRERRPEAEVALTHHQRTVLRRMRLARKRLLSRSS